MPFPLPPPRPFQRLQASDGLLIRAEHWQRAHEYHRLRQNLHFQALHQPGIVSGLGVRPIAAPSHIAGNYQDGRWVQVDPGLAIDVEGNPIVVPQAMPYRIGANLPPTGTLTVYLVIRYVDPDSLRQQTTKEFVTETFRLDERTSPPQPHELELCRIQLAPPLQQLELPHEPLSPQVNQLDLTHRLAMRSRAQGTVRIAQGLTSDAASDRHHDSLVCLMEATQALYPALSGHPEVDQLDLMTEAIAHLSDYDLIYLTGQQPLALPQPHLQPLQTYLANGGVVLVDPQPNGVELAKSLMSLAHAWQLKPERLEQLPPRHPLRRQPFLFALPPKLNQHPLQVLVGGGLVLTNGLALGWGLEANPPLPREGLRSAQELGINLLHYAWRRRHLAQLTGHRSVSSPTEQMPTPALPETSLEPVASGSNSVFDQFIE